MWELPEFARFLDRLAGMGRLITFDKRGTGLSDRAAGVPTLEQRADDIRAVMDAAGSARAAIVAWGEGAAIGAMFAATYPERVAALVLGSLPVKITDGPVFVGPDPAVIEALSAAVETAGARPPWYRCLRVPSRRHPLLVLVSAVGAAVVNPERSGGHAAVGDAVRSRAGSARNPGSYAVRASQ